MVQPIDDLARALAKLPGFGHRSAGRAALALVREPERLLDTLLGALRAARESVVCCARCGAFTVRGADPCGFCTDAGRDASFVCVVEDPADVVTLESSGAIHGRYHVLGGKLSAVRRMGPDKLRVPELKDRIVREGFSEVMLAVSTDMEGDATAGYVAEVLRAFPSAAAPVKVARLAFGLPADSGVAYSDPLTLKRAISARQPAD